MAARHNAAMNEHEQLPTDLLHTTAAARLIPGAHPGKTIHVGTLFRWIHEGRLRAWKVCGRVHVSRGELLALVKPVKARAPRQVPEATRRQVDAETRRILERFKLA